jgi:PAS domain-containing protein
MGTIYIYFRLRSSNFRRVRRLLEERVEVKTKQLTEKNLELEKLSIVASRTDNSVIIANTEGVIEWVNDSFYRMTGIPKEKLINRRLAEINVYNNIEKEINDAIRGDIPGFLKATLQQPGRGLCGFHQHLLRYMTKKDC